MKKTILAIVLTIATPAMANAGSCGVSVNINGQGYATGGTINCTLFSW
jgi:hypothetical protein